MYPYRIPDDPPPRERSAQRITLRSRLSAREADPLRYAAAPPEESTPQPARRPALRRFVLRFGRTPG